MQNGEGCAGVADAEPHASEMGLMDPITCAGLDVHKATVSVALSTTVAMARSAGFPDHLLGQINAESRSHSEATQPREAAAVARSY